MSLKYLVIIIGIVAAIGGVGLYLISTSQNDEPLNEVPENERATEEKVQRNTSADQQGKFEIDNAVTSDWQIYRNEERGFQIRHPDGWHIFESPLSLDIFVLSNYTLDEMSGLQQKFEGGEIYASEIKDDLLKVDITVINDLENWRKESKRWEEFLDVELSVEKEAIGIYEAEKITSPSFQNGIASYLIPHGNGGVALEVYLPVECRTTLDQDGCLVFSQIFSTFRFFE
jgi:hypothetical protein